MNLYTRIEKLLDEKLQNGTTKYERVVSSAQGTEIKVNGNEFPVVNLCSNDYLGLANHPSVLKAAHRALDVCGYGLSSVRFICGTLSIHKELEARLADFLGMDDALLYSSCFSANGGLFESVLQEGDSVISARLNHASIIDGVRLSKARRFLYAEDDPSDLERSLSEAGTDGVAVVVTDGVFSMEGNFAPLDKLSPVCRKHSALLAVDDSHATGLVGRGGRGTPEHFGVEVDILTGTLGKALGGAAGGYVAGKSRLIEWLRNTSRPYLFSNSLAPSLAAGAMTALDIVRSDEGAELRAKLKENTAHFRGLMQDANFEIPNGEHAIIPVMFKDAAATSRMADRLLELGVYVIGFSYPVVPKEIPRIRVQISAAHTHAQLECAAAAFATAAIEAGVMTKKRLKTPVCSDRVEAKTMRAWVYRNEKQADGGHLVLGERPVPVPQPGELLLKILRVSVCGTDEDLFRGKFSEIEDGIIPGHEIFGEIVGWGSNVRGFELGQRIVAESHYTLPGYVEEGIIGLWGPKVLKGGYLKPINGGYAEYVSIPSYCAHIVPEVLDTPDFFPSLLEGAGNDCLIAKYLLDRGLLDMVGVVGCGVHGLFAQMFCKHFGAERLAAFEVDKERMEFARDFGADVVIDSLAEDSPAQIDSFTNGKGFRVMIDIAGGSKSVLDTCLKYTRDGGTLILFGLYADDKVRLGGIPINDIVFAQRDMDVEHDGKHIHIKGITGREGVWEYLIEAVAVSKELQRKLMSPVTIMGPLDNLGSHTLSGRKAMKRAYTAFSAR